LRIYGDCDCVFRRGLACAPSVGRTFGGMAGPWRSFTRKKSFTRGGRSAGSIRPRVRAGTIDGHTRRDSWPINRVMDFAGDQPFVPKSVFVDLTAWNDRGGLFLAAGSRTAHRSERKEIIPAWRSRASHRIPAVLDRSRDFWRGRF